MVEANPFATRDFVRLHAATSKETAILNFVVILRSTSNLETKNIFKLAAVGSFFRCFVFCHRPVTVDAQTLRQIQCR